MFKKTRVRNRIKCKVQWLQTHIVSANTSPRRKFEYLSSLWRVSYCKNMLYLSLKLITSLKSWRVACIKYIYIYTYIYHATSSTWPSQQAPFKTQIYKLITDSVGYRSSRWRKGWLNLIMKTFMKVAIGSIP